LGSIKSLKTNQRDYTAKRDRKPKSSDAPAVGINGLIAPLGLWGDTDHYFRVLGRNQMARGLSDRAQLARRKTVK
jgi:hypothetical protein